MPGLTKGISASFKLHDDPDILSTNMPCSDVFPLAFPADEMGFEKQIGVLAS